MKRIDETRDDSWDLIISTGCVYGRMWSSARRLHGEKCWGANKQRFCNKMNMQITNKDITIREKKKCVMYYRKRHKKDCHHGEELKSID